jgi:ferredoxin-nitrate reductase
MDIGVKGEGTEARIVGVRGRAVDRVNKGRLGPKGMPYECLNYADPNLVFHRDAWLDNQ